MRLTLNGFTLEIALLAERQGHWDELPLQRDGDAILAGNDHVRARLNLRPDGEQIGYRLAFDSDHPTRLRLRVSLPEQEDLFHLIPGNIFGDNNAPHVAPGQFPCLSDARPDDSTCAPLWEFRADRAPLPVSILCCRAGAIGLSIDPYSDSTEAADGFIRNGLFAALPDAFGVSLGYGNEPLTFVEKTSFSPPTADRVTRAAATGRLFAIRGPGRQTAHAIIAALYRELRSLPTHTRSHREALRALADAFAEVNWSRELQQYTNRKCRVPADTELRPWRAIVEIGWTGGSMMAYPFFLAERIFDDLKMPKSATQLFDEICTGYNERSGFINDTAINRFTRNRPEGWNDSEINGWWSGFLPRTRDAHCAYTNAQAAYYLLRTLLHLSPAEQAERSQWRKTALAVLDTAISLQRDDGAFGYLFSSTERRVTDWEGFAGCWFIPALVHAWQLTGENRYRTAAERAMPYYHAFVRQLSCWGSPMDTYKSVDSEGNLAFIRSARLLHEQTGDDRYLAMLIDGARYEYLWRYGFRTRPQVPPLKESNWNSCGGSLTSVSNPHIHPMSVVVTDDLIYLAKETGDVYHQQRADDGLAWLMNTMELYPDVMGYGRYGVLSERTCPSDGLLAETYSDGRPASTWWSYNAWAAASAMEALAVAVLAEEGVEKAPTDTPGVRT